jgi:phage tail sheath protein FI
MARASYFAPGVYVEEVPSARQPIAGVGTSTAAFIGIVPSKLYVPVPNPDYDPVLAGAAMDLAALRKATLDAPEKERKEAIADEMKGPLQVLTDALQRVSTALKKATDAQPRADALEKEKQKALTDAENALTQLDGQPEPSSDTDKQKRKGDLTIARTAVRKAKAEHTDALAEEVRLREEGKKLTDEQQELKDRAGGGATQATGASTPASSPSPDTTAAKPGNVEKEDLEYGDVPWNDKSPLLGKSMLRPYSLKRFDVSVDPCDTKLCTNFSEYTRLFGPFSAYKEVEPAFKDPNPAKWQFRPMHPGHRALTHAVKGFFDNGGTRCYVARIESIDQLGAALKAFESIDEVALFAVPGIPKLPDVWEQLTSYCEDANHENCFAVLDSPEVANDAERADLDINYLPRPRPSKNAAYYFPWIEVSDPAKQLQDGDPTRRVDAKYRGRTYVPPSGHVIGIYARTDVERGVHKAPANAVVRGALEVKYYVSKPLQESLNPEGVNAIRIMSDAVTLWGARTIGGDRNGEWKYINVRRLFLFLQESIDEGTQWVVFEPNDPALWGKIRLNISAFLTNVWRNGALFGLTPEEAFYVKCDAETNPPEVRDLGQVITEIGVAIVRPAEFVIFRITQATGQRP